MKVLKMSVDWFR